MGRFVLAVAAQLGSDDARLARLGENLYTYLKDEVPACYIAMGTPGHGINGYRNSYSDALQGIRILQRLATNKHIMHYNEYQMFRLLEYLPDKARESFRVSYLGFSEMDSKLALTLTTYFDSDLSPAITASTLGIHRNTLAYRLNRIKQQYGLDPYRFHDAVALQMLLYMQDSSK
jgi:carbohydrate diacid regulator